MGGRVISARLGLAVRMLAGRGLFYGRLDSGRGDTVEDPGVMENPERVDQSYTTTFQQRFIPRKRFSRNRSTGTTGFYSPPISPDTRSSLTSGSTPSSSGFGAGPRFPSVLTEDGDFPAALSSIGALTERGFLREVPAALPYPTPPPRGMAKNSRSGSTSRTTAT